MKVWIVCDNNETPSIRVFENLEKAQKFIDKYDGLVLENCWTFDKNGTKVE